MRTLFFILLFLASTAAVGQNVPHITVSKEKVKVNGSVMFVHKVKGGETLYSLAKAYNVTIDDIVRQNESLRNGLKAGSVIYIPSAQATTSAPAATALQNQAAVTGNAASAPAVQENSQIAQVLEGWELSGSNIKKYSRKKHKVKRGEQLGNIARKYNVSQESIIAMNSLESTVLRKRQILYIPNADFIALIQEQKNSNAASAQTAGEEEKDLEKIEIVEDTEITAQLPQWEKNAELTYVLPLSLKDTLGPDANFMDFYAGALLAADTLKKMGYNITINVVDQQMYGSIEGVMGSGIIDGKKVVVGPVRSQDIRKLLEGADDNTTVISPMDMAGEHLALGHSNFIQAPPSTEAQLENLVNLFAGKCDLSNGAIVIYEKDGNDTALVASTLRLLDAKGIVYNTFSYSVLEGREILDNMMFALEPTLDNMVLVPSNSEAFVNDVVRNLNLLHTNPAVEKKRSVTLFGTARWRNFETIEVDYFHRMNLHLSLPYYVDYSSPVVKGFLMKYRALYNAEPSPFAFQGFDITMMAMDKTDITTQSRYKFTREQKNTGMKNTGTINIKYGNNYQVTVIE